MKVHVFVGIGLLILTADPTRSLAQQNQEQMLKQLGPAPSWITPRSLEELVNTAQAAVIAEIVGPGELKIEQMSTPGGTYLGPTAYTTYRVVVRDVLYNRDSANSPRLTNGNSVEFTQHVGRDEAEAFVARQVPVVAHDVCLFFLWRRRGASEWSIFQWPLQFRKSLHTPGFAEPVAKPTELPWLDARWLGPSVPLTTDEGRVLPMWPPLVDEVKRLGGQRVKQLNE